MCIQYFTSCLRCQADVNGTIIKCPWTDIPGNCQLCSSRELSGFATICIDCWLWVNTEYLLSLEREQLAQETRDTKIQEKHQEAEERTEKEVEEKIEEDLGWEQCPIDGWVGGQDSGWERWIVKIEANNPAL